MQYLFLFVRKPRSRLRWERQNDGHLYAARTSVTKAFSGIDLSTTRPHLNTASTPSPYQYQPPIKIDIGCASASMYSPMYSYPAVLTTYIRQPIAPGKSTRPTLASTFRMKVKHVKPRTGPTPHVLHAARTIRQAHRRNISIIGRKSERYTTSF